MMSVQSPVSTAKFDSNSFSSAVICSQPITYRKSNRTRDKNDNLRNVVQKLVYSTLIKIAHIMLILLFIFNNITIIVLFLFFFTYCLDIRYHYYI